MSGYQNGPPGRLSLSNPAPPLPLLPQIPIENRAAQSRPTAGPERQIWLTLLAALIMAVCVTRSPRTAAAAAAATADPAYPDGRAHCAHVRLRLLPREGSRGGGQGVR